MTLEEFSNEFDTLLNSNNLISEYGEPTNKQSIVLDEYEKSVFLTQAQEEIIIEFYTGKINLERALKELKKLEGI